MPPTPAFIPSTFHKSGPRRPHSQGFSLPWDPPTSRLKPCGGTTTPNLRSISGRTTKPLIMQTCMCKGYTREGDESGSRNGNYILDSWHMPQNCSQPHFIFPPSSPPHPPPSRTHLNRSSGLPPPPPVHGEWGIGQEEDHGEIHSARGTQAPAT